MTLDELKVIIEDKLQETNEDFGLADGADSNFHYLEGQVDAYENILAVIDQ